MADAGRAALDPEAGPEIDWLIRLVGGIRRRPRPSSPSRREQSWILHVQDANAQTAERLDRHLSAIQRLARIEAIGSATPTAALRRS